MGLRLGCLSHLAAQSPEMDLGVDFPMRALVSKSGFIQAQLPDPTAGNTAGVSAGAAQGSEAVT